MLAFLCLFLLNYTVDLFLPFFVFSPLDRQVPLRSLSQARLVEG